MVKEYRAKVEADRQDLVRKMAEEDAQISAESTIMFKASARSEELEKKYEHLSSQVAEAEAAVAQAEAALEGAQKTLADYRSRQAEIRNTLRGLEFAREAAVDNLHQLFASRDARRTELSIPPLPEADMKAMAREEAQNRVHAKVEEINLQIQKLLDGTSTL